MKFAVIGDIHGHWSPFDSRWFAESDYDAVLVVGDLGLRWGPTLAMARTLAEIDARVVVFPGNHDGPNPVQLLGEVSGTPRMGTLFTAAFGRRMDAWRSALEGAEVAAYSAHTFGDLTLIAGRPHSMGGPNLSFADHLGATHGVHSLADSTDRLRALIDEASTDTVAFLAHNGPTGLGATRTDIWGCDFKKSEGDWGDPDLEEAVRYAKTRHRVPFVVAGHMHRRVKGGDTRAAFVERDGTVYVNAAEVPRIRQGRHHHVSVRVDGEVAQAEDVWVTP